MPIEDCDYFVRLIPFPTNVAAFIRLNSDGTVSLYLNANLDREHHIDGYEHELWHMIHDDLYGEKDICEMENALRQQGEMGIS